MINFIGEELNKKELKQLKAIYKYTLKKLGQNPRILETNVKFVLNAEMQELNLRTREVDYATDVLSFPNLTNIFNTKIKRKDFPLDINPENNKVFLGDIVINLDKAISQALEFGHTTEREVCYLFVHGLLHLLEFDHIDDLDKNIMRIQEEEILSKFKLKRS
ncbi:MAG: rRNA maturation RNase YbeY [Clostridiales bacterium]|nr:rRNA maturation RNase YbeY [Clostridiales bacterium]